MLWLRARNVANIQTTYRAVSSVAHSFYPPKVRAFPFALSAEEAIARLSPVASIRLMGRHLFRSIGAYFLPGLFEPLRPKRIQAMYLPVWVLDAEVEAKVSLQKADKDETLQGIATVTIDKSYMPGFVFEPLSRISFNSPALNTRGHVRFSDDLLTQRGSDILCLPFTHTPFALVDAARSLSYQQATISERFRFDPSTVRANMLAAYPVLVPIYLAQYDSHLELIDDENLQSFTFILEAHSRKGRIIVEGTERQLMQNLIKYAPSVGYKNMIKKVKESFPEEEFRVVNLDPVGILDFANVHFAADVLAKTDEHKDALKRWLDKAASTPGLLEAYATRFFRMTQSNGKDQQMVDWEDLRIREFTPEERIANIHWMTYGQLLTTVKNQDQLEKSLAAVGLLDTLCAPRLTCHLPPSLICSLCLRFTKAQIKETRQRKEKTQI
ncbi:hypothetical protein AcW1_008106 [Taiwanofungus camphoratus]|nr:hypothetical protein AcV5_008407 [Antrodia cinnamomea]KAI0950931.1 hypothetical protein AcW1_008106 [Antrodia cinnamomea]